jgi:NADPH:quinone reductase-like Zn-dependent oxidoreductase
MKAVLYDTYGPPEVLHLEEVERPVPKVDEVLVNIHAATVNRLDVHTREANRKGGLFVQIVSRLVSGFGRPRQPILGSEFAGEVVEVGAAVREFAVGDRVFGNTGLGFGTHAEFVCVREGGRMAHMPAGSSFEHASAITDGALNALWSLKLADVHKGQKLLVYGASGSIGSSGVQLAKHFGADVTGVTSTKNLELVRSIGADRVIDYSRDDFTKNGETYDAIFDAVGKHSFERCKGSLKSGGKYLATDGFTNVVLGQWTKRFGDKRVVFELPPRYTKQNVIFLKELMEGGEFKPVIDRCYPMDEVVEAARYVETERKTGNVVLTITAG